MDQTMYTTIDGKGIYNQLGTCLADPADYRANRYALRAQAKRILAATDWRKAATREGWKVRPQNEIDAADAAELART